MISRELDGLLEAVEREKLGRHLASCEECRAFSRACRSMESAHHSIEEMAPPSTLFPSILAAVSMSSRVERRSRWLGYAIPAAAAAAAVLGFWIGGLMHERIAPRSAGETDVLELGVFDEYPPGSFGDILAVSEERGADGER
jgi:anti-sigma factor RsiW